MDSHTQNKNEKSLLQLGHPHLLPPLLLLPLPHTRSRSTPSTPGSGSRTFQTPPPPSAPRADRTISRRCSPEEWAGRREGPGDGRRLGRAFDVGGVVVFHLDVNVVGHTGHAERVGAVGFVLEFLV